MKVVDMLNPNKKGNRRKDKDGEKRNEKKRWKEGEQEKSGASTDRRSTKQLSAEKKKGNSSVKSEAKNIQIM